MHLWVSDLAEVEGVAGTKERQSRCCASEKREVNSCRFLPWPDRVTRNSHKRELSQDPCSCASRNPRRLQVQQLFAPTGSHPRHHTELLPELLRTNQNRGSRSSRTSCWWATELGCDLACEHPVPAFVTTTFACQAARRPSSAQLELNHAATRPISAPTR